MDTDETRPLRNEDLREVFHDRLKGVDLLSRAGADAFVAAAGDYVRAVFVRHGEVTPIFFCIVTRDPVTKAPLAPSANIFDVGQRFEGNGPHKEAFAQMMKTASTAFAAAGTIFSCESWAVRLDKEDRVGRVLEAHLRGHMQLHPSRGEQVFMTLEHVAVADRAPRFYYAPIERDAAGVGALQAWVPPDDEVAFGGRFVGNLGRESTIEMREDFPIFWIER